jgi:pyruvyl transferase EpsO
VRSRNAEPSQAPGEAPPFHRGSSRAGREPPRDALVLRLATRIDAVLAPLIPAGSGCALLDFPTHSNVGDSAIWLGQRAHLARAGVTVAHVSDAAAYAPAELRRRLPRGPILLSGGGSLGDLWPDTQRFREQVIRDFPERPIVQLPQSVHFRDPAALDRARRVFEGHRALTLLVRDQASLALVRGAFRVPSALCPDMTFALGTLGALDAAGPLGRRAAPRWPILWLARSDVESQGDSGLDLGDDVVRMDWRDSETHGLRRLAKGARRRLARWSRGVPGLARRLAGIHDLRAEGHLSRGRALLGSARVVITDRLHGHILSLLLGIPHVLLDDRYGKVRGFYHTWTRGSGLVRLADSPGEALRLARAWVGNGGSLDR